MSRARPSHIAQTLRVALALSLIAAAAPEDSLEYAVKATFLYKFVPFVDWPASAFESPASPVVVCVIGNDPVTRLIDRAAAGQRAGGRPIVVRHLAAVTRDSGCHEVYAGVAAPQRLAAFEAVRGTAVLTVSDGALTGDGGGIIIGFVIQDNRVRFDIDAGAAAASGLTIRSQLLDLARNVRPRN